MPPAHKFNGQWFQGKCENLEITQRRVAKVLKLNPASVTATFQGKRKLQIDEAVELARLFNVELDEVLRNAGVSITAVKAPKGSVDIVGWIDEAGIVHRGPVKGARTAPMVPSIGGAGGRLEVLRYQAASGMLGPLDGALIYYVVASRVPPDVSGRLCVVGLESGGERLATVKPGYSAGVYNLLDMAGRMIVDSVVLRSAAPVILLKL